MMTLQVFDMKIASWNSIAAKAEQRKLKALTAKRALRRAFPYHETLQSFIILKFYTISNELEARKDGSTSSRKVKQIKFINDNSSETMKPLRYQSDIFFYFFFVATAIKCLRLNINLTYENLITFPFPSDEEKRSREIIVDDPGSFKLQHGNEIKLLFVINHCRSTEKNLAKCFIWEEEKLLDRKKKKIEKKIWTLELNFNDEKPSASQRIENVSKAFSL